MEKKENVYLEKPQPETDAKAQSSVESENAVKEVSTVLGKFKDVDALARAYSSLQAEFTRRSQRLKELERETGKRYAEKGDTETDSKAVAEKLRKNAESVREEGKKFSSFVAELEQVGAQPNDDASLPDDSKPEEKNLSVTESCNEEEMEGINNARIPRDASVAVSQEAVILSKDELFAQANRNEEVRLKIIGEYLTSLKRSNAPLMTGGAGTLAAPPLKAKTLEEAGNMALRFFKNNGQA